MACALLPRRLPLAGAFAGAWLPFIMSRIVRSFPVGPPAFTFVGVFGVAPPSAPPAGDRGEAPDDDKSSSAREWREGI